MSTSADQRQSTGSILRYLLPAVLIALVLVLVANRLSRDERAIRQNFNKVLSLCSKTSAEGTIVSAARAGQLTEYFSTNMALRLGARSMVVRSKGDLQTLAYRARTYADSIRVKNLGHSIEISKERGEARMDVSLEAVIEAQQQTDREVGEFRILWVREEGHWRIQSVESLETIQRPRLWDAVTP